MSGKQAAFGELRLLVGAEIRTDSCASNGCWPLLIT